MKTHEHKNKKAVRRVNLVKVFKDPLPGKGQKYKFVLDGANAHSIVCENHFKKSRRIQKQKVNKGKSGQENI